MTRPDSGPPRKDRHGCATRLAAGEAKSRGRLARLAGPLGRSHRFRPGRAAPGPEPTTTVLSARRAGVRSEGGGGREGTGRSPGSLRDAQDDLAGPAFLDHGNGLLYLLQIEAVGEDGAGVQLLALEEAKHLLPGGVHLPAG